MLSIDDNNELLYIKNGGIMCIAISKVLWLQKGYLFKNLTELEYKYVICPECEGIMREEDRDQIQVRIRPRVVRCE